LLKIAVITCTKIKENCILRHLKKIKMKRIIKAVSALALITFFAACNKDDDSSSIPPPRDYAVQYATEKAAIEDYLETHYIASVDADYNVDIQPIPTGSTTHVSIMDQTEYPIQSKIVNSNGVDYTLYYLMLREGENEQPTKYDNVRVAYRGILLDGTQFDFNPVPQNNLALLNTIEAWQEILPLFKSGTYVDIPGDPNPPTYDGYGAGVMFVPSGLAYYNGVLPDVPSYSTMVFSFKLYDVDWADHDNDGIFTKDETIDGTEAWDYDTDDDGIPNYLDTDDDNDGFSTRSELRIPATDPVEYYTFENIPLCTGGTIKRHLDPNCH
jgi:FKBP-type peptidyl-prolyl cis-trans isomerase FkpA